MVAASAALHSALTFGPASIVAHTPIPDLRAVRTTSSARIVSGFQYITAGSAAIIDACIRSAERSVIAPNFSKSCASTASRASTTSFGAWSTHAG